MLFKVRWLGAIAAAAAVSLSACQDDPTRPRNPALTGTQQANVQVEDILTRFSATLTLRTWREDIPLSSSNRNSPVSFQLTSARQATGTWNLEVSILGAGRGSAIRKVLVPGDGSPVRYLDEFGAPVRPPVPAATVPGIPLQQSLDKGPVLKDGWHEAFIIASSGRDALTAKRQRLYGPGKPRDSRHDAYATEPSPGNRVEEIVDRETGAPTERTVFRDGSLHARTTFETTPLPAGSGSLIAEARTVYQGSKQVLQRTLSSVTTTFAPRQ